MIELLPVEGLPEIQPGADLGRLLASAVPPLVPGDIIVVAQKIVSKAEGRIVRLDSVEPSDVARNLAATLAKDPRLIELILLESRRIVRMDQGVVIVETHHGFVCANAGIDLSNVDGGSSATLLPKDPDASAARIARELRVPVIISDTFGRPWREGIIEVAIGVAGLNPLSDYRGQKDSYGYDLRATIVADADQLAAAAGLVFRKTSRTPACVVRGFTSALGEGSARDLVRDPGRDLFR